MEEEDITTTTSVTASLEDNITLRGTSISKTTLSETWVPIWNTIIKKLSYNIPHIVDKGLLLLKSIIDCDLIENSILVASQDSLWKLPQFSDPSRIQSQSLELLVSFMQKYELQEDSHANSGDPSRREALLQCLFLYLDQVI